MQSFIIEGDSSRRLAYIDKFIKARSIKDYNILRFSSAKIQDVRFLQKTLVFNLHENESRAIILDYLPTLEAQNALLKTLEEPPVSTFFLLSVDSKDELLPTVISRCMVISQGIESRINQKTNELDSLIDFLQKNNIDSLDKALEFFYLLSPLSSTPENVHVVINSLRNILIKSFKNELVISKSNKRCLYLFLNEISTLYPLITSNNLNSRFCIEYALLSSI